MEAAVLGVSKEQDPWVFLDGVQNVPATDRSKFYQQFVLLCTGRSAMEKDQLGMAGKDVFKYRMETFRKDLERAEASGGDQVRVVPSIAIGGTIAEMIWRQGDPNPIQFAVYCDGAVAYADKIKINNTTYLPPQSKLVEVQAVMVPSAATEYGTDHDLYLDVRHFIDKYLYVEDPVFQSIMSYYVLLSWVFDCFRTVPYIRFQGDFGSGKTRGLETLGAIVYRGIFAAGATTPAPLFRIIDTYRGTLVLDEADFEVSEAYAEIIKILNVGYSRRFSVLRCEKVPGDNFDVRAYDCFGPKIIATRNRFKDQALESRCLTRVMGPVTLPRRFKLTLGEEFDKESLDIRNKLLMWRFRNHRLITLDDDLRFEDFEPRMNQIIQPLLSCTQDERVRAEILDMVTHFQRRLQEERRESISGLIAISIAKRFAVGKWTTDNVLLKHVCETLMADNEGLKIEPRKVGELIRREFNLRVENRGGVSKVWVTRDELDKLYNRYTLSKVVPRPEDHASQAH